MAENRYVTRSESASGGPIPGSLEAIPKSAQLLGTDENGKFEARSIPVFDEDPEGTTAEEGEILAIWLEPEE